MTPTLKTPSLSFSLTAPSSTATAAAASEDARAAPTSREHALRLRPLDFELDLSKPRERTRGLGAAISVLRSTASAPLLSTREKLEAKPRDAIAEREVMNRNGELRRALRAPAPTLSLCLSLSLVLKIGFRRQSNAMLRWLVVCRFESGTCRFGPNAKINQSNGYGKTIFFILFLFLFFGVEIERQSAFLKRVINFAIIGKRG